MELKWERVYDIEDLKVGDIIRTNPNYNDTISCFVTNKTWVVICQVVIEEIETANDYRNRICYKKTVTFENGELNFKDHSLGLLYINKTLLYSQGHLDSWIERLIIKEDKLIEYSDEIDLLLDNIMTNEINNIGQLTTFLFNILNELRLNSPQLQNFISPVFNVNGQNGFVLNTTIQSLINFEFGLSKKEVLNILIENFINMKKLIGTTIGILERIKKA